MTIRIDFRCVSILAMVALAACADSPATNVDPQPSITATATTLSTSLRAGNDSSSQSFSIITDPPGLPWSASSNAPWLTINPTGGVTPATITVTMRSVGLTPGQHSGIITVTSPAASNSPLNVLANLTVSAQPSLSVQSAALSFNTVVGATPGTRTITVTNTGSGALSWTAIASDPWIMVTPTTGVGDGVVAVGINTAGLTAGTRQGTVTIAAAGATGSPVVLPVTLALNEQQFAINALVSPATGGNVTGTGTFASGSTARLEAQAGAGYDFVSWTEAGAVVSTAPVYSFIVSSNKTLTANFRLRQLRITATPSPAVAGTTSGTTTIDFGSPVTVSAFANAGYVFAHWTENGIVVATSPQYSFTATANRDLMANFVSAAPVTYAVSTAANPTAGGSTNGGGAYNAGSTVTVSAVPASGYAFTNWTENGTAVSASATYSFTVNANRTLTANFSAVPPPPPQIAAVVKHSGDLQTDTVAQTLTQPLVVKVVDTSGNTMPGVEVTWTIVGFSATTRTTTTNSSGFTSWENLALPTQSGTYTVKATAGSASTSFTVTAVAGSPQYLEVQLISGRIPEGAGPYYAAQVVPVRASVLDYYRNPVANMTVTFEPRCDNVIEGTVDPATVISNAQGIAATTWTLSTRACTVASLKATAGTLSTTSQVLVLAAPPYELVLSPDSVVQSLSKDGSSTSFRAYLKDRYGNLMPMRGPSGACAQFNVATGDTCLTWSVTPPGTITPQVGLLFGGANVTAHETVTVSATFVPLGLTASARFVLLP